MVRTLIAGMAVALAAPAPAVVAKIDTRGFQPCGATALYGRYFYVDDYGSGLSSPASTRATKRGREAGGGGERPLRRGRRRRLVVGRELQRHITIARVDPATLKVVKWRIRVGLQPWDVTFAFGSVWSSNFGRRARSPASTRGRTGSRRRSRRPGSVTCIRARAGSIWVAVPERERHLSHRPGDEPGDRRSRSASTASCASTRTTTACGSRATSTAPCRASIPQPTRSSRPFEGRQPARPTAPAAPTAWSGSPTRAVGTVTRIDPKTNKVVSTVRAVGSPFVARAAFGDVWSGEFQGSLIWRIHVPA